MSSIPLLMGLLVLAYAGEILVRGGGGGGSGTSRRFGPASGIGYVLLGVAVGPYALGLVPSAMLKSFDPLAHVALGWIALAWGLQFGKSGAGAPDSAGNSEVEPERGWRAWIIGTGTVILGIAAISYVVALATRGIPQLAIIAPALVPLSVPAVLPLLLPPVIAICVAESSPALMRVLRFDEAPGRTPARILEKIARSQQLPPIIAMAFIFPFLADRAAPISLPWYIWGGANGVLGIAFGLIATLLFGREFRLRESWGVLLGCSIVAIGTAARLNLSIMTVCFFMSGTVGVLSRHRGEIAEMVAPTERSMLLPVLVLAGCRVELMPLRLWPWIAAAALGAKLMTKLVGAIVARLAFPQLAGGMMSASVALTNSGPLTLCMALAFALRSPGALGDAVLAVATTVTLLGELMAPAALRRFAPTSPSGAPPSTTESPLAPGNAS